MGRWFAALTETQLRRGVFRSTRELEQAIERYIWSAQLCAKALDLGPILQTRYWALSPDFVIGFVTQDNSLKADKPATCKWIVK